MFLWDMMNTNSDQTSKKNDDMNFPFMPPFPISPFMIQMSVMPLASMSYLMQLLEKQKDKAALANLMNDEGVKKIIRDLMSVDVTPEQLTKLQNSLDSIYGLYTKMNCKEKK